MDIFYKNILEVSEEGNYSELGDLLNFGDGTTYAYGAAATVDQDNRQFTVTDITFITDVTAADNIINGYILYFPSTGNRYHITDYTNSSKLITVYEVPDTSDTTAYEVRMALYEGSSSTSSPIHYLANKWVKRQWTGQQGVNQEILVSLPNYVLDGGFEERAAGNIGGDWTAEATAWQVSATAPLLGARMAVWTIGGADSYLYQNLTGLFIKGRSYTVLMKVQAVTGNPAAGVLAIQLRQQDTPNANLSASVGTWTPTVTTTAGWVSQAFTADFSTDEAQLFIDGITANKASATAIRVDEVYVYETLTVDQLIMAWHNVFPQSAMTVRALRCNNKRTGYNQSNDSASMGSLSVSGKDVVSETITSYAYPVYRIYIPLVTGKTFAAGLIGLYGALTFRNLHIPYDEGYTSPVQYQEADSGVMFTDERRGMKDTLQGVFRIVTAADYVSFEKFYKYVKEGKRPFWLVHDSMTRLVRIMSPPGLERRPNNVRNISITFTEEVDLEF